MLIVGIPKSEFGPSPEIAAAPHASGFVTINGERMEYRVATGDGFWFRPPGTEVWDKRQILDAGITDDDLVIFTCSAARDQPSLPITMIRPGCADGEVVIQATILPPTIQRDARFVSREQMLALPELDLDDLHWCDFPPTLLPLCGGWLLSPGAQYLAHKALWLLTDIVSYSMEPQPTGVKGVPWQFWTFTRQGDGGVLECREDTGKPILVRREYHHVALPIKADEFVMVAIVWPPENPKQRSLYFLSEH